uniref:Uncharacterized protein n=1 Tax=Arundo donax TaxID=35708 RepID=A0A0A9B1T5_ARUDO
MAYLEYFPAQICLQTTSVYQQLRNKGFFCT